MPTVLVKVDKDDIGATVSIGTATRRVEYREQFARVVPAMERRMADFSPIGPWVVAAMRKGPGSIDAQFEAESEARVGAFLRWPKTKPFGNRPAPAKTLQRTGALRSAWVGQGPGAISKVTTDTFSVGVDSNLFPQAPVFQSLSPTVIRAKKRGKGGRLAMQMYLGMQYGVWISARKLLAGLVVQPRRVGVGTEMRDRVSDLLARYVIGEAPLRSDVAA